MRTLNPKKLVSALPREQSNPGPHPSSVQRPIPFPPQQPRPTPTPTSPAPQPMPPSPPQPKLFRRMTGAQVLILSLVLVDFGLLANATHADEFTGESTQREHGTVRLLSEMLAPTRPSQTAASNSRDAVIDLETEDVVFLMGADSKQTNVAKDHPPLWRIVPFLSNESDIPETVLPIERPVPFTRESAARLLEQQRVEPYWTEYVQNLREDLRESFDTKEFALATFSELKGRDVKDRIGKSVGRLVDFGVRKTTNSVAYCVMATEVNQVEQLRAIPLAAFVRSEQRDGSAEWTIELDAKQIMTFEPFESRRPPQQIDRGWQEYVAVRYGRSGVQEKKDAAATKDADR